MAVLYGNGSCMYLLNFVNIPITKYFGKKRHSIQNCQIFAWFLAMSSLYPQSLWYGSMYCIISLCFINVCHTIDSSVMYIYLYANDPQFVRCIWTKSYKTFARKNLKQFRKITLPLSIVKCGVKKILCHSTISLLSMLNKFSKSPKNLVNSSISVKLFPKISIFLLPFLLYF